jgi:hypothetical protein
MRNQFLHVAGVAAIVAPQLSFGQTYTPPPTIPTVVAEAMSLDYSLFGPPRFFDAKVPSTWPIGLIPPTARVLGGGVVGLEGTLQIQAAVFAFAAGSSPTSVIERMLTDAGFLTKEAVAAARGSGFLPTDNSPDRKRYCKGMNALTFGPLDTAKDSLVVAIHVMSGPAAANQCDPPQTGMRAMAARVSLPGLVPPPGGRALPGGSSWSGDQGEERAVLISAIATDSALMHYRQQLISAGWTAEGKPASLPGLGVQRFSFRQGSEKWLASLTIITLKDRHEITVTMTRAE